MMNKARIEALSDGVFSIVMTLLIIDIRVPPVSEPSSTAELINKLLPLWPLFRTYYVSFAVLGMYWIAHHSLFHLFAKHAGRGVTYLNILFLCFISLIPFSAHLAGQYPFNPAAVFVYGGNVIIIGMVQYFMLDLTVNNREALHEAATQRLINQAKLRMLLPPAFAMLGIIAGFFHSWISFILFAFPVVFNIIPGSLKPFERH